MVRKQLGQGSGTLVSRCLVVTNEHVVSKGGAIEVAVGDAVTFYAGSGRFEGFAEWVRAEIVALGARRSTGRLSDDWTVLRLDRPLGDRYGWIEVATVPPESRPSLPLWALGFPNDGVAIAGGFTQLWSHRGCRFLAEDGHRWASDCVANVGQSGGPVLALADDGRVRLVAMITGIQPTPPAGPRELPEWQKRPYTVLTAADAFIGAVSVAQKHDCPDVVQEKLPR